MRIERLQERMIEEWFRRLAQAAVLTRLDHSDNLAPDRIVICVISRGDEFADGILSWPKAPRYYFVDYHRFRRFVVVLWAKLPARQQRNSHRLKISWANRHRANFDVLCFSGRLALDPESLRRGGSFETQGQIIREACREHSGHRLKCGREAENKTSSRANP